MKRTELEKALLPMSHHLIRFLAIHSPAGVRKMLVWADTVAYGRTQKIG